MSSWGSLGWILLKKVPDINFIGNIEGKEIFDGKVDVVVCDGFTGNIVLKCCEGIAKALFTMLRSKLEQNTKRKVGALLAKNAFKEVKEISDYAEYGGAPLLGVKGTCIIGHGGSCSRAVKNAIRVASEIVQHGVNDEIIERVKEYKSL